MKTVELKMAAQKDGKPYKKFQMEDGKWLSVFQFDSRYNDLTVDMDIADDLLIYDKTYDNYKLKPLPRPTTYVKGPGGYKSVQMEKVMEKKEASIEKFQGRKEESIKLAGAMRDATLITLASLKEQPFPNDEDFQREYIKWCKWLLNVGDQPFL